MSAGAIRVAQVFNRTGVDWAGRTGGLWGEDNLGGFAVGGRSGDGPGDDGSGSGGSGGEGSDDFDGGEWEGERRHYSRTVRAVALVAVVSLAVATVGAWTAIVVDGTSAITGTPRGVLVATVHSVARSGKGVERVGFSVVAGSPDAACTVTVVSGGAVLGTVTTRVATAGRRTPVRASVAVPLAAPAPTAPKATVECVPAVPGDAE